MIPQIKEINFPQKGGMQYATLTHATVKMDDMGEKNITTQVKIDGKIVPDFSFDWEVEFQGEKYIMPLRIPQGAKENTSLDSTIDLTFQHWAIYQLKRWQFVTIQQIAAGTYLPNEEEATVSLNLKDFCILFGEVLEYYYGNAITIDLNPAWQYDKAATVITISHTKIWNVLIDTFYDKYGVRWEIVAASDNNNETAGGERYVIKVGYGAEEVDHIFEYGFEGGLLKVERQVQSEEIRNILKGRGGDTNIPLRYFKDTDPNNKDFHPDPDWIKELANIYFTNLMPATFRSYVQGWKAAHINDTDDEGNLLYEGYRAVGESNAYAPWAYRKGYTDTKFHPVEFVADEITISPETGDKQVEILPGYSPYVKKGSSLDKYSPLPDTLDNDDDVYPTIQGTGFDIAVAVEQIESDDVAGSTESDAQLKDIEGCHADIPLLKPMEYRYVTLPKVPFEVEQGKTADILLEGIDISYAYYISHPPFSEKKYISSEDIPHNVELIDADATITVYNALSLEERSAIAIPGGSWYYEVTVRVHNLNNDKDKVLFVGVSLDSPKLLYASIDGQKWSNTFNVWIKNVWGTTKRREETVEQYSRRVWTPVLGDRDGKEAAVVFTSGALAHEDYEFKIPKGAWPVVDGTKEWTDGDGVTHESYWRMTLAKSEAELEATGLYVPSTRKQGKAGDTFVFIGTEMMHVPYVVDAEIRLDDRKKDKLGKVKEIKPTAVVTTDRVRLNNGGKPNALINQLRVGNSLRLFDKRFFNEEGKTYETLYLQSITYTYREPSSDDAALNPDVEIVLGNEYATSANPVSMMQGEISALQRQVGSISNIEQIVRAVGDSLYLRKDGISDRSLSPTQFFSLLTSGDFRAGLVGGAGWGLYKDENGNWVLETDKINVRQDMNVNSLVINQAEGRGGMQVDTAAFIEVTRVIDTGSGYVCYFDQKGCSLANLFHVDDVAFCNRWTPQNEELKYYKRRVVSVGTDSITLSNTDVDGEGVPEEGDNIIHFGNYVDKTRQYVKVRDVVNGGYERYIEGLDSVTAKGEEYYFVGKQYGMYGGKPRWFIGERKSVTNEDGSVSEQGEYIEWVNGELNIKGRLSIGSTIGGDTFEEYIKKVSPPTSQEDIEEFVNNIVNPIIVNVNKLSSTVDGIKGFTDKAFSDGIIDRSESAVIQSYLNEIKTVQQDVQKSYDSLNANSLLPVEQKNALASAKSSFDLSANALVTKISEVISDNVATSEERASVNSLYETFSTKYGEFVFALNQANSTITSGLNANINKLGYLTRAFKEITTIENGLILSSVVSLGVNNEDFTTQTAYSGISGIHDDSKRGGGIAAWYGGDMIDKFDYYNPSTGEFNVPTGTRVAMGLDRMDGTGYRANGNLWWDANGVVHADPLSFFVGEATVGALLASFQVVMQSDGKHPDYIIPKVPFQDIYVSNSIKVGDGYLKWDSQNKGFYVEDSNGNLAGFYGGWLSARGINQNSGGGESGGGSSYLKDLLDVQITNPVFGQILIYDNTSGRWVNSTLAQHLPSQVFDKEKMWAELAIVDTTKKIDASHLPDSVVTSVINKAATLSWDAYTTVATIGDTDITIKMPESLGSEIGSNFVTSLGTKSSYYLTWTKNGVENTITVPYASKTSTLSESEYVNDLNSATNNYFGKLLYAGGSNTATNKPTGSDAYGMLVMRTASGWTGQMLISANSATGLYWRTNPNTSLGKWNKVVDSTNYATILDDRYYTETEIDAKLTNGSVTKIGTNTIGSTSNPTYLNAGTITACLTPASGTWFQGVPSISNTGVMKIGRYIDFHPTSDSTVYFGVRLDSGNSTSARTYTFGSAGGEFVIHEAGKMIGGTATPIYIGTSGMATSISATVGSTNRPVYLNAGTITAGTYTFGNKSGNAAINNSTVNEDLNADLLDGWHGVGNLGKVLRKSGYVATNKIVNSYWAKVASFTYPNVNQNSDITFYMHSSFNNKRAIVHINVRNNQNNVSLSVSILVGNISTSNIRLYYDSSKSINTLELWYNTGYQYNQIATYVISETYRATQEQGFVTLYNSALTEEQTPTLPEYISAEYVNIENTASAANKLSTARNINGTPFDGSADITTENWGKSRTIKIGNSGKSVNGSGDVEWTLNEIGAVNKAGDTMTGRLTIKGSAASGPLVVRGIHGYNDNTNTIEGLYLQYGANNSVYFGNTGSYRISADGEYYSGRANKANVLNISRSIWGQPFDGSSNVSGTLTNVLNITMSGNLYSTKTGESLSVLDFWQDGTLVLNYGLANAGHPCNIWGNVGINERNPTETLHVNGTIYSTVGIYSDGYVSSRGQNTSSDMRLKNIVNPVRIPIAYIANAPIFLYTWKDRKEGKMVGTSAQYWEHVLPESVRKDKGGYLSLMYGNTAMACVVSLAKDVETIDQRVKRLEIENKELRRKLNKIKYKNECK